MHEKVKGKLFSLFTGELFSTIMFAVLWMMYNQFFEWTEPYLTTFSSLYAFVLLELILLQGSFYWFLKWKQVRRKDYSRLSDCTLRLYVFFKRLNLFFIALGLLFMIYQFWVTPIHIYWFIFLYAFAIIEYINYYHVRLSYMSVGEIKELIRQKRLRRSKLARELDSLR